MKMSESENSAGSSISADWLWNQLRETSSSSAIADASSITLLDCRSAAEFGQCHIRRAVHLSLPSIMLRRLAAGKVTINSVLKSSSSPMMNGSSGGSARKHTFVLCGGSGDMMAILRKSLMQDGCPVVCLQGGVEEFRNKYPEWCISADSIASGGGKGSTTATSTAESSSPSSSTDALPGLRIASGQRPINSLPNRRPGSLGSRSASDSEEERPDSSLESTDIRSNEEEALGDATGFNCGFSLGLCVGLRLGLESEVLPPPILGSNSLDADQQSVGVNGGLDCVNPDTVDPLADPGFPVEILPHLFLGNAQNSRDCDALDKHQIRYVVNVTPNLPNVFEDSGTIRYLQIPIQDHWSQNLASFFPTAINFIDGARERQEGVLVHCLAGISRSVTITVAYLMYKMSMSLNDAYDFVRRKKSNISPNFNFMGQLLDFERQLNPPSPQRCTCHLAAVEEAVGDDRAETLIPFTRLSIEEKDDEEEDLILSSPPTVDSGLPSSVSLSPCSVDSSASSSPAVHHPTSAASAANPPSGAAGGSAIKRMRTLGCRCQASLAQCHFTTPT